MNEIKKVLYDKKIKVEKIYSYNAKTDWETQDVDEFVYLLNGEAILEYENKEIKLKKDDFEYINKGIKHRVKSTSDDCIWLCVFMR